MKYYTAKPTYSYVSMSVPASLNFARSINNFYDVKATRRLDQPFQ